MKKIKYLTILFGVIGILLIVSYSIAQDQEIIKQIKKDGPGKRFAIAQIQPIQGHKSGGYKPVTFTGPASMDGDLSWGADGMTMAGNGQIIRFTNKTTFLAETIYMGPTKVYFPKNIKGYTFESQTDNPLTFILMETHGLVYVSGHGGITFPDGKTVKLPKEDLTSLKSREATTDNSKVTISKNETFYVALKELQVLTEALKVKDGFLSVFVVDKISEREGFDFDASDLNRMSQIVKRSNDITKVTIKNGKVRLEFPGDKMILSQFDFRPVIWHIGATIRFDGEFKLEGYTFIGEGDQSNRLTFKVDESGNFKYISGKGRVIMKDGKEIKLGY